MKVSDTRARAHGEVLTPQWMVEEMLAPLSEMLPTFNRILDLCAGPGAFISNMLNKMLSALEVIDFHTVSETLKKLYAFELLEDNIFSCRKTLESTVLDFLLHHGVVPTEQQESVLDSILRANITQTDILEEQKPVIPVWNGDTFEPTILTKGFFDYIVSNPPYQKNISGSTADNRLRNHSKSTPIYQFFYDWARSMDPEHMSFIIPAKWYAGGWGLDKWRQSVLDDKNIAILHDYRDSGFIFKGTEVNGGICWLLRQKSHDGDTRVVQFDRQGVRYADMIRPLKQNGAAVFVRDPKAASILEKVGSFNLDNTESFSSLILSATPFGIPSNFTEYQTERNSSNDVALYFIKKHTYWVSREQVLQNVDHIDSWKVFLSLSYNQHSAQIINDPVVFGPGSVCSHSYIAITGFKNEQEALNAVSYMKTKFFRYLASQLKVSPIATRKVYRLAPLQDWSKSWSDDKLYEQYGFDDTEIAHIESTISTMCVKV